MSDGFNTGIESADDGIESAMSVDEDMGEGSVSAAGVSVYTASSGGGLIAGIMGNEGSSRVQAVDSVARNVTQTRIPAHTTLGSELRNPQWFAPLWVPKSGTHSGWAVHARV